MIKLSTTLLSALASIALLPGQDIIGVENRNGVATWENDARFPSDTFHFARLKAKSHGAWSTDYPDSDLNFSFRLQQMTSIKVNPDPIVISPLDEKLKEYPFLYQVETGNLALEDDEAKALRDHLTNGGFLMIDDFFHDYAWQNTVEQVSKIFPDRKIKELTLEHPIFNIVFKMKVKPQVLGIGFAMKNKDTGITSPSGNPARYYGVYDDKDRMMILICRDTDIGDGWEREGENQYYFKEFSEKYSFPMGINIITYMMTN